MYLMTIVSRCALTVLAGVLVGIPPVSNAQNQTPAKVAYDGDATARNHARATLSAVVTDDHNNPAEGGELTFTLGSQTCSAVADKAGKGACTVIVNQPAGKYTVRVDYSGRCVAPCNLLYAGGHSETTAFVIKK
jgi:hypothetical protein